VYVAPMSLAGIRNPQQTETNWHVRVTSGFTPITDINLGQIARKRLGGQT